MNIRIIGAGSIGIHHSRAAVEYGCAVSVEDLSPEALARFPEIYAKRYGAWNNEVRLGGPSDEQADIVIIGTPPDSHLALAIKVLESANRPKVLMIEKPLCSPTDDLGPFLQAVKSHPETKVLVGFNHLLAANSELTRKLMGTGDIGALVNLTSEVRSHWQNIFAAHPWLSGPEDTYLGYWKRGGGAGGEHSHAINLWIHFAEVAGMGRPADVSASIQYVDHKGATYDSIFLANVTTEKGLLGTIAQDVVTTPTKRKAVELQFESAHITWLNDVSKTADEVQFEKKGVPAEKHPLEKTRVEEFAREMKHMMGIASGEIAYESSPIHLKNGIYSSLLLTAAHKSAAEKKTVPVDYSLWDMHFPK
ncbi:MAG: Gfo/Idh/MocA family oxidoreductase [Patescibacteria group bacterium]